MPWKRLVLMIIFSKILSTICPGIQNLGQSRPKSSLLIACSKFAPKSIHQIERLKKKYIFFQLPRGYTPPRTRPCMHKHSVGTDAPRNHSPMSKTDQRTWQKGHNLACDNKRFSNYKGKQDQAKKQLTHHPVLL